MTQLTTLDPKRVVKLNNISCIYCSAPLNDDNRTLDHVVGRRFVPRGTLNKNWNLHAMACRACNNGKSDLEDDISAVTMQPDLSGALASDDERLREDSVRKGKRSRSRRTKKSVGESHETMVLSGSPMPGVAMSFTMHMPPQVGRQRVAILANLHITALFYWLTFNRDIRMGGFWPGDFVVADDAARHNRGNVKQVAFRDMMATWDRHLHVVTAGGFFKAAIWRTLDDNHWSWALEWNQARRMVGFLGIDAQSMASSLPTIPGHRMPQPDGSTLIIRQDVDIPIDEDLLFA